MFSQMLALYFGFGHGAENIGNDPRYRRVGKGGLLKDAARREENRGQKRIKKIINPFSKTRICKKILKPYKTQSKGIVIVISNKEAKRDERH